MDDVKHTPGPWGIEETQDTLWVGPMRQDGQKVAAIVVHLGHGHRYLEEVSVRNKANARLIAAAPDMLEALRNCAAILPRYQTAGKTTGDDEECAAVLEQVTEAIATAEGRQP